MQFEGLIATYAPAKKLGEVFVEEEFLHMTSLIQYTSRACCVPGTAVDTRMRGTAPTLHVTTLSMKQGRREAPIMIG